MHLNILIRQTKRRKKFIHRNFPNGRTKANRIEFMHTFKDWHCGSTKRLCICVFACMQCTYGTDVRCSAIQHAYCTKHFINDTMRKRILQMCTCTIYLWVCVFQSSIAFALWLLFMLVYIFFDSKCIQASAIKYNSFNRYERISGQIKVNDERFICSCDVEIEMSANCKRTYRELREHNRIAKQFNNYRYESQC